MKLTALVLAFPLSCLLAQTPVAWTPELSMQVQTVGDVTPSPDGQMVCWTQTRAVMELEKSQMVTQIFLGRADGSQRLQLTRGEKSSTSPSFSPDGRYVYFVSERSGKPNIYRIAVDGGEAEALTDWKGKLGAYRASPDGKWLAFTGVEESAQEEQAKKEKLDFRVVDENPKRRNLWIIPSDGRQPPRKALDGTYHVAALDWSPDSRSIAFEHWPRPEADFWRQADLSEVDVDSGTVRPLAATGAAETSPRYSPDGRFLVYLRTADPPRWAGESRLVLLPRQGGAPRTLPPTPDEFGRNGALLGWSADSSRLIFTETKGTRTAVYAMPIDGPLATVYEPARGAGSAMHLNTRSTHLGFAWESSEEAPEAYLLALAGGDRVRVSRANLDLPNAPLGQTASVRWKAEDGLEIEGLLTYPVGYEAGRKYPLVLVIHGGPMGVFTEQFIGRHGLYPYAAFSTKGFAVLRPNPRGSSGYGKTFRFANYADWGGKDYEDLMAGVDHAIAIGVAAPDRLAVMGWSYGGFMTSWVVTHTDRFRAAAVGAGVTNLWSFTGTADIPSFLPDYFRGEFWENFDGYRKHSPMTYVKNVKTPTLILHGEADDRVPVSQGYELYQALKRLDVPTKMVVYPRTPHSPTEPKFVLDIMRRHVEWVEKHVPVASR